MVHAINERFGKASPKPFPIPPTSNIPIFSDNVIPSLLVHLGVIDLSASQPPLSTLYPEAHLNSKIESLLAAADGNQSKTKVIPKEGPILTSSTAYYLRAAAIDACELIVQVARSMDLPSSTEREDLQWIKEITLPKLDLWLWAIAKDRLDYRMLERFVQKDTVFF